MHSPLISRSLIVTAALLLGATTPAMAAECKGMEKNSCERNESRCTWVNGYTRGDGVKVSGYCRSKGGKKSSSTTSSTES